MVTSRAAPWLGHLIPLGREAGTFIVIHSQDNHRDGYGTGI